MTKFLAHRVVNGLQPMDAHGVETVRALPLNTMLKVQVSQPRNPRHHRLFWALASLVHQTLPGDQYPTVENFVAALKLETGIYTEVMLSTGEVVRVPGSISFAAMDQTEFARFFNRCCDHIIASYWPDMTSETLRREVAEMTGIAPPGPPVGDAADAGDDPANVPPPDEAQDEPAQEEAATTPGRLLHHPDDIRHLRRYSRALGTAETREKLASEHQSEKLRICPSPGDPIQAAMSEVFRAHQARLNGHLTIEDIDALVDEMTGEVG